MAIKVIQERRNNELLKASAVESHSENQSQTDAFVKYDLVSLYLARESQDGALSDKQLRDIVLNFLIAGRDTTAQVYDIVAARASKTNVIYNIGA